MKHSPVVEVRPGNGGEDAVDFARLLEAMYAKWDGSMNLEAGTHRLARISPFDEKGRRHSSFATVIVDGDEGPRQKRSYVLHPYEQVIDYELGKESPAVSLILFDGRLDLLYEGDDYPGTTAQEAALPPSSPSGASSSGEEVE